MQVEIRLLTERDAAVFREHRLKSYLNSPLAFSESYEDEIKRSKAEFAEELKVIGKPPESFVLGAFTEEGKLVGFVKFRRDTRSKARHKSMIHSMYVDATFRKYKIGRKLIADLLERVKTIKGLEQIHLWVLHSGSSVAGFYHKCGFRSQGTIVKKDLKVNGVYVDAEYMVMYLEELS